LIERIAERSTISGKLRLRRDRGIERARGAGSAGAKERRGDLVVSDVVMPEMDGPTLFKAIRGRDREFKILFISGYAVKSMPNNRQIAFLPKPFTFGQLITAERDRTSRKRISAGGTRRRRRAAQPA
jgi:two-component system, cell cycle sensor histidine kinase and response regulator CckA